MHPQQKHLLESLCGKLEEGRKLPRGLSRMRAPKKPPRFQEWVVYLYWKTSKKPSFFASSSWAHVKSGVASEIKGNGGLENLRGLDILPYNTDDWEALDVDYARTWDEDDI